MLGEGGMIVLYTDGLTEARNEKREMLGMQRWMEIVKNNIRALADGDMLAISEAGMQFTGNAEQADDMTLMAITKTSRVQPLQLHVESRMDQWPMLRTRLHNYGSCAGMDARTLKKMELAIEEMVVNIINYSESDWMEMTLNVTERISSGGKELRITLRDNGGMFDPTRQAEVDTDALTADRQVGGLGIALVRQIADDLSYNRKNGINELTIIKAI
jgi:sigma-B regulation protein RsbU (phosphoserine phosphatase)